MYRLELKTFFGGEARIAWSAVRGPSVQAMALEPPPVLISGQESKRSALVNRSDSEEGYYKGVSGFGLLPSPTKFGLPARRQVKRLSSVLDSRAQVPQDVIFFTGTLPGSTKNSMLALSQWSGFVVHRLKAWMHDLADNYSCVYCWEWQKRGALHIHIAVYVKSIDKRNAIFNGLKMKWITLLEEVSDRSGIDLFKRAGGRGTWRGHYDKIRARAEWVKKSVASYLGKYLSKAQSPSCDTSRYFYPSRWWGSTQNLKDIEKAHRTSDEYFCLLRGEAEGAYNSLSPMLELFSEWSCSYRHRVVEGNTTVAVNSSVPMLRKLFRQETFSMDEYKVPTWVESLEELRVLLDTMESKRPDWMKDFRADCDAYDRYRVVTEGLGGSGFVSSNDYACCVMAVAFHLNYHVTGGSYLGHGPISYWGLQVVRRVTDQVANSFNVMGGMSVQEALSHMTVPGAVRNERAKLLEEPEGAALQLELINGGGDEGPSSVVGREVEPALMQFLSD